MPFSVFARGEAEKKTFSWKKSLKKREKIFIYAYWENFHIRKKVFTSPARKKNSKNFSTSKWAHFRDIIKATINSEKKRKYPTVYWLIDQYDQARAIFEARRGSELDFRINIRQFQEFTVVIQFAAQPPPPRL